MSKCRICKSTNLKGIISLGNQYLSEFRGDNVKPPKSPLDLVICEDCKQVQLMHTAPVEMLYTDNYGYRSGINYTMRSHLRRMVEEVQELKCLQLGDIVLDIGSNDGTLLKYYPNWCTRVGYDLVPKFGRDYLSTQIEFVNKPFTASDFNRKAMVITAISMFYDLDDPVALMQDMADSLAGGGVIIIQQNYLLEMLKNNAYDNICHEHLCYHSVQSMQHIVNKCGLEIFDIKVVDLNGGSFRVYIGEKGIYMPYKVVQEQLFNELEYGLNRIGVYREFADRVKEISEELYNFISDRRKHGESVYVYGASTRGNTLLQYSGLDNNLIQKAVERNPDKFGKKIASLGIPIISEEEARQDKPDYMLVLPWFFRDEFLLREGEYLRRGGKWIFPLPRLEVIG